MLRFSPLSDNEEAAVMEVFKSVAPALNKFHLARKSIRDAVVFVSSMDDCEKNYYN